MNEVAQGRGSPSGGVYASLTHCPKGFIEKEFPTLYNTYIRAGIDPYKDMFEVAPTCHFFMGGVEVGSHWETNISGLYCVAKPQPA